MNRPSHQFLRSIILFGFVLFLIKLMISGDIQKFIAPRMMPYMYFTLIVLGVLASIQFFKSGFEEQGHDCGCGHNHDYSKSRLRSTIIYLLFIIPVMTGMMFSDHVIGSSAASNKGFKYEMRGGPDSSDINDLNQTAEAETLEQAENPAILTAEKRYPELSKELQSTNSIHMTADNYIGAITLMEDDMDPYVGKKLTTHGFVFRDNNFPDNQIVIGRLGISCCVADAGIYGILVQGENLEQYKNDTWVEVTGTLEKVEANGWELPLIQPEAIKPMETPPEPYVYEDLEFGG
ncbi:TIGR03943 family putative permease subunit [Halobacillus litoralis]|uniref:TIGR03943 family putative permease subunit n=1 Tax=Halobacillus litoralis TaxID=45668 RepID=UPI001CD630CE|nr:TIGR03943 family protein [Halobacillus litoralis]MCA1021964.1 TIGR03943 family protein [Halobacillus litoralis]